MLSSASSNFFNMALLRGIGAIIKAGSVFVLMPTFPNIAIKLAMFYGAMIFFYRLIYLSVGLKMANDRSINKLDVRFASYIVLQSSPWSHFIAIILIYLTFSGHIDDLLLCLGSAFSIAVIGGFLNEKVRYAARGITLRPQWHYEAFRVILEIIPALLAGIIVYNELESYFLVTVFITFYFLTICLNYFYLHRFKDTEIRNRWSNIIFSINDRSWFYFLLFSGLLFSLDRLILGFFIDSTKLVSYISYLSVIMPPVGFLSYLALWGLRRSENEKLLSIRYISPIIVLTLFWIALYLFVNSSISISIQTLDYWRIFINDHIFVILIATLIFYYRDLKMQSYFESSTKNLFFAPIGGLISLLVCVLTDVSVAFYVIVPVVCSLTLASTLRKLYG